MPKLKVYRTPIGFHDAYVAAPSQRAALKAWGADADLFARGAAEVVTDAGLTEAPLAHPGEVIRLRRGTEAEHLKALARTPPAARRREVDARAAGTEPGAGAERPTPGRKVPAPAQPPARPAKPRRPRPSRAALDKAEAAIRDAENRFETALEDIAARKRALDQELRDVRTQHEVEMARLDAALKKERTRFTKNLEAWAEEDDQA